MPNEDRHILVLSYMQVTGSRLEYGGLFTVSNLSLPFIYNVVYAYGCM